MHDNLNKTGGGLTYADYCALPDDGKRYEILDGELFVSPSPIRIHQRIVANLHLEIAPFVRSQKLGEINLAPFDVLLSDHNIVEPDLIYVSTARMSVITDKNIQGAPDLLIEVLSPSTKKRDFKKKRDIYAEWGVDWYWIVDPDAGTLMELKRADKSYEEVARATRRERFEPDIFPGLTIEMDSLWD